MASRRADTKSTFFELRFKNYATLVKELEKPEYNCNEYDCRWVFRGQLYQWSLETTLERACRNAGFTSDEDLVKVEDNTIREFRRRYDGSDFQTVIDDTLYCMTLMRHAGAPTRLLDFSYSMYVAAYFALEHANDNPPRPSRLHNSIPAKRKLAIWCINSRWMTRQSNNLLRAHKGTGKTLVELRYDDSKRNDTTFRPLYLNNKNTMMTSENPILLHQKMHLQQSVFLCPGNIRVPFEDNIRTLEGWQEPGSMRKLVCTVAPDEIQAGLDRFMMMNISRESLFPGLDGFAQAMNYQLFLYKGIAATRGEHARLRDERIALQKAKVP